ncbi:MAG: hypothetical protein CMJ28_07880 [Phycisphaerae bacterium]|nr:hypothetical protein [Phycisphaerae bacterium]
MTCSGERRFRLGEMLEMAQRYRGWSRRQLAKSIGRDPTKLIPSTGLPRLDFLVELAGVLDWEIDDLVSHLWGGQRDQIEPIPKGEISEHSDFNSLDQLAKRAHLDGNFERMIAMARAARTKSQTPTERALTFNRESGGWDGLGRFRSGIRALRSGLRISNVDGEVRRMMQSNLSGAHYGLWSLVEARGTAVDLIDTFRRKPAESIRDHRSLAFAHLHVGQCARRRLGDLIDHKDHPTNGRVAVDHLLIAKAHFDQMHRELGDCRHEGISRTCTAGILEAEVALGHRTAERAIDEIHRLIEMPCESGDALEAQGWSCIYACNIVLRSIQSESEVHRHLAILTNKAQAVAEKLNHWPLRERVFTMEYMRWEQATGAAGIRTPKILDHEEFRTVAGMLCRFPNFQERGWKIIRSAHLIES